MSCLPSLLQSPFTELQVDNDNVASDVDKAKAGHASLAIHPASFLLCCNNCSIVLVEVAGTLS